MYKFGEKHPVVFEIILIVAAFLVAGVLTGVGNSMDLQPEESASIGRIITGAALLIIFRRAFRGGSAVAGLIYVIPALLFAVWNIFYNLSSGAVFGNSSVITAALLTAFAPAIFEEVIFRGIFIYNLRKKGSGDLQCLFITAIVFSLIHATNIGGLELAAVALQLVYSLVVGMVLAAVFLRNNSILQIIIAHFLIDFTNRIYVEPAASASTVQIIIFCLLLAAEALYAVKLVSAKSAAERDLESAKH